MSDDGGAVTHGFVYKQPQFSVTDLGAALTHYREVLGFEVLWVLDGEDGQPEFANVARDELAVFLLQADERAPAVLNAHSTGCGFIDELHAAYVTAGANVTEPPSHRPWGLYEMRVEDLDGNVLRMQASSDDP